MTNDPRFPRQDDEDLISLLVETVTDLKKRVSRLETSPADDLEIKATAGDFAVGDSWDGRRVLNTADTTYKIFLSGAWRTLFP